MSGWEKIRGAKYGIESKESTNQDSQIMLIIDVGKGRIRTPESWEFNVLKGKKAMW